MIKRFELFVTGITTCYKYIQKIKSFEMVEFGLKGTHVMCLFYLGINSEGLTATELCSLCSEDKAAISRTINDLIAKEYIVYQQTESNKKKYRAKLFLTDKGKQLSENINVLISLWVESGGEGLSDEERNIFYNSLSIISSNLKNRSSEVFEVDGE